MNFRNVSNLYQLVIVIFILRFAQGVDNSQRTFEFHLNPGCNKECEEFNINIAYIRAEGPGDVLHFLYSGGNFTETLSSIIIRSNNLKSYVYIDWAILTSQSNTSIFDSFKLVGDDYPSIFAVIFTKLYANDTSGKTFEWNLNEFEWHLVNKNENNFLDKGIQFQATKFKSANDFGLFSHNGSVNVDFLYSNLSVPSQIMPHLQFNSNNTQFNLILRNLNISHLAKPRFTFQFALANRLDSGNMILNQYMSIDDESSPGVFRVLNFYGQNNSAKQENTTYVQWKPVSYSLESDFSLQSILSASYSIPVKVSEDANSNSTIEIIKQSLAYIVLQDGVIMRSSSSSLVNITFGDINDKPYDKYNIWTASFGYGQPPEYLLSMTIIMIICFGLGVPFVIIVAGSIYIVIKKRLRQHRLPYVSIDEHIN